MRYISGMAKEPCRGVFWVIDGDLLSYPFIGGDTIGVAKSGLTYKSTKALTGYVRAFVNI